MKTMKRFLRLLCLSGIAAYALAAVACNNTENEQKQIITTQNTGNEMLLIDTRNADEYAEGHVRNAILIPYTEIAGRIAEVTTDRQTPVHVYCRTGRRAGIAKETLESLGYRNVTNLGSVEDAAKAAGRPIVHGKLSF